MKSINVNITLIILFVIIIFTTFNSCRIIKGLKFFNTKKIKQTEKIYKNKTVKFIELHHAGRIEYYNTLKDTIKFFKQNDYIVFYETVKKQTSDFDSISYDILLRKFRKMIGILPNRKTYGIFDSLEKFSSQPPMDSLNIDNKDINADVSVKQLIVQYEKNYDKIVLDSIDMNIPLDEDYLAKGLKNKMKIILNYRNKELAKKVYRANYNKILIIYGEAHRKGFFKELDILYGN